MEKHAIEIKNLYEELDNISETMNSVQASIENVSLQVERLRLLLVEKNQLKSKYLDAWYIPPSHTLTLIKMVFPKQLTSSHSEKIPKIFRELDKMNGFESGTSLRSTLVILVDDTLQREPSIKDGVFFTGKGQDYTVLELPAFDDYTTVSEIRRLFQQRKRYLSKFKYLIVPFLEKPTHLYVHSNAKITKEIQSQILDMTNPKEFLTVKIN